METEIKQYNIFDLGFSKFLSKESDIFGVLTQAETGLASVLGDVITGGTNPVNLTSGEWVGNISIKDGYLQSANFVTGSAGWRIDALGNVEFSSGVFRGSISIGSGNNIFKADSNGIYLGNATFASAPFSVSMAGALVATNATITGNITATTGVIGGWTVEATTLSATGIILDSANQLIQVGSATPITIDGANKHIHSDNYVSGVFGAGFYLDSNLLEVGNIACRGLIRTAVFQKDVVSVMGGNFAVLDGDVLDADMTVSGGTREGLVSYYKLDEASGDAIDSVGGNDGTVSGATPNQAGKIETAYSFDGNDYIDTPMVGFPEGDSPRSLSFWVYKTNTAVSVIYGYGNGVAGQCFGCYISNIRICFWGWNYDRDTGADITLNKWEHIVMTYDGVNVRTYLNGELRDTGARTLNTVLNKSNFGRNGWTSGNYLTGSIDELGIWNRVLTEAEVTALYNADSGKAFDTLGGTLVSKANTTFVVGDILRIKDGVDDEWMEVTNIGSAPTYIITRDKASAYGTDTNPTWKKGATIVNYKQSGAGGVYMTASESNAPYLSIFDHAGSPWSTINTRLRIGNLNGYLGYDSDLYGIAIGETEKYLKYDTTNGLRIKGTITISGGSGIASLSDAGDLVTKDESAINTSNITNGAGWTDDTTANLKRRVFVAEPTTPYNVADLWANGTTLKKCTTERLTGAYNAADWGYATGYTDDTTANAKIKTFYQDAIPTSVSAGDLWVDTNDGNKLYRATAIGDTTIAVGHWVEVPPDFANVGGATKPANNATVGADESNLSAGALARLFADSTKKTNIEAWIMAGHPTYLDGTDIWCTNLAAINADLGAITAGTITLPNTGWIKGGQTDYNTGVGFFLGYSTDAYKFSVGEATKYLKYDTTNGLMIRGSEFSITNGQETLGTIVIRDGADAIVQRYIFQSTAFYSMSIGSVLTNLGSEAKPWGVGFLDYSVPATLNGHIVHKKHLDDTLALANQGSAIFGSGKDGDVTISSNTTLTSDKYYNNLTINNEITLNPGGYRIFVKGTLTLTGSGKIARDGGTGGNGGAGGTGTGNKGTGGTAGTGYAAAYLSATPAGTAGGIGGNPNEALQAEQNSVAGTNITTRSLGSAGVKGGNGGAGGNGSTGGIGTAGNGGTIVSNDIVTYPYTIPQVVTFLDIYAAANPAKYNAGAGGSGGGSGAGGKTSADNNSYPGCGGGGGGAGGNGGIVCVYAKRIVLTGTGTFSAQGGAGGNGGNGGNATTGTGVNGGGGGAGGGAGGNGGFIVLVYGTFSDSIGNTDPVTATCIKIMKGNKGLLGTGGLGKPDGQGNGADGYNGTDGANGNYIVIKN